MFGHILVIAYGLHRGSQANEDRVLIFFSGSFIGLMIIFSKLSKAENFSSNKY